MATNSKEYNKKNYKKYWGNKKAIKDRSARNLARRKAMKAGKVRKGDNKEIDHIIPLSFGGTNNSKNLRVISRKKNRQLGAKIANRKKTKK